MNSRTSITPARQPTPSTRSHAFTMQQQQQCLTTELLPNEMERSTHNMHAAEKKIPHIKNADLFIETHIEDRQQWEKSCAHTE